MHVDMTGNSLPSLRGYWRSDRTTGDPADAVLDLLVLEIGAAVAAAAFLLAASHEVFGGFAFPVYAAALAALVTLGLLLLARLAGAQPVESEPVPHTALSSTVGRRRRVLRARLRWLKRALRTRVGARPRSGRPSPLRPLWA